MKHFFNFYLLLICISQPLFSAGFAAKTLIYTIDTPIPIEQLTIGDDVISYHKEQTFHTYPIIQIHAYTADYYIQININDVLINAAPDQVFYAPLEYDWLKAEQLNAHHTLLCCDGSTMPITDIRHVHKPLKMYAISVKESHIFCVSPYKIIAHNCEPATLAVTTAISIAFPPAAPILIGAQVIGSILAGIGCYHAYKQHQRNKTFAQITEEIRVNSCSNGSPEEPEDDEEEHPHGLYKDASYHHPNSKGKKSPSPKDGQKCLDYSLPYQANQRIGIEDNTFVLLKQTSHRLFHGHLIEWGEIIEKMRDLLQIRGYVKRSGQIIKQITTKVLS